MTVNDNILQCGSWRVKHRVSHCVSHHCQGRILSSFVELVLFLSLSLPHLYVFLSFSPRCLFFRCIYVFIYFFLGFCLFFYPFLFSSACSYISVCLCIHIGIPLCQRAHLQCLFVSPFAFSVWPVAFLFPSLLRFRYLSSSIFVFLCLSVSTFHWMSISTD